MPMKPAPHPHLAILLAFTGGTLTAGGCAGTEAASAAVERDSAGVKIVENDHRRPIWTAETAWRVADEPTVRIGDVAGDTSQLLYQVPWATRLRDGRIAVVNSGSQQVRFYDDRGVYLGSLGGRGDGPGEFRYPWMVYETVGDSLVVVDLGREVSVFDAAGNFARRFLPKRPADRQIGEGFEPEGQFGDGSLLFKSHHAYTEVAGLQRNQVQMLRLTLDGDTVQSIGDFPDQTFMSGPTQYIFGAWASEAPADSTMWYGPGDRFEIQEVNYDGNLLRLIRLDRPPRPITQDDVDAFVADIMRRVAGTPREEFTRRMFADPQHPETFPAHFTLKVDAEGNLWAQDYQPFRLQVPRIWTVFDRNGHYLGDVTVPGGVTVHEIGSDYLIGVFRDDVEVEYVHVYSLEKPRLR